VASYRREIRGAGAGELRRIRLPPGELIQFAASGAGEVTYSYGNNGVFATVQTFAVSGMGALAVHPGADVWVGWTALAGSDLWVLTSGSGAQAEGA